MFVTIINDCLDENALGRQATKVMVLLNAPVITIGVKNDLEAAGNLIDILDAGEGQEGVVLVNVAPRNGKAKKWSNGTPFGYFYFNKTLVVSSIDGLTLSLVKKLQITKEIRVLDIAVVMNWLENDQKIKKSELDYIIHSQFRSLEFIPRVAKWLRDGFDLPYKTISMSDVGDPPSVIWWVDNFGNCKTTLLPKDVSFMQGKKVSTEFGDFKCCYQLKDVPDGEAAIIIGSSGLTDRKFLEIVIQGKSAQEVLKLDTANSLNSRCKLRKYGVYKPGN